jgi:hypothetical protein
MAPNMPQMKCNYFPTANKDPNVRDGCEATGAKSNEVRSGCYPSQSDFDLSYCAAHFAVEQAKTLERMRQGQLPMSPTSL